ncbi:hypothetical protein GGF31_003403 [Allomyces arbusculus]|nr:hypothetical protein GGF31_003403 [Allomyces arbusculus]
MASVASAAAIGPCPKYRAFLLDICDRLAASPNQRATLSSLEELVSKHESAQSTLGGVQGLAVDFPKCVRVSGKDAILIARPVTVPDLVSDRALHLRRHALRLLFAYHGNRVNTVVPKDVVAVIVARHAEVFGGLQGLAKIVEVYPQFIASRADGSLGLVTVPPSCLQPVPLSEPLPPPSSLVVQGNVAPDVTVPSKPKSLSSNGSQTWKPLHKHNRCDILVVTTGVTARHVQVFLTTGTATMLALDIEGNLTRGASASIDVIQIMSTEPTGRKPSVFVWDFARAASHDHTAMVTALRAILEDARHTFVVHDGRPDADVLAYLFGITLPRTRTLDTQVLFKEWVELSITVRSALGDKKAVKHCAPLTIDSTRRAELNVVLAACGLPINKHKKTMAAAFKQLDGGAHVMYWNLHADATLLLEYAAFDVDQLAQAADVLLKRIKALTVVRSSLKSGQHVHDGRVEPDRVDSGFAERGRAASGEDENLDGYATADEDGARGADAEWRTSPLPKSKPVKARFVANGQQLEWRDVLTAHGQLPADYLLDADSDTVDLEDQDPTEMDLLLDRLPDHLRAELEAMPDILASIDELVLDLGQVPQLFIFGADARTIDLDQCGRVTRKDLAKVCDSLQFTSDNRAGLEGCLHRISRLLNWNEQVVGVTIRVGRASAWEQGVAQMLLDLLYSGERSILILGRPGSGKTYTLRDLCARLGKQGNRVMIVDTSNEIGGDGDIPHASLGKCRRMQVRHRDQQHAHLIEAVQNHTPNVIVMDEIGTRREVNAARTVEPRVRAMLATAHGTFRDLIKNSDVRQLLGGIANAMVGDAIASAGNGFRKTRAERVGVPVFDTVVELLERGVVRVYHDVAQTVDDMLEPGCDVWAERRWLPGAALKEGGEELPECRMEKGAFWAMLEQV